MTPRPHAHAHALHPLAPRLAEVRAQTLALAAPLSAEDCQAQSMPDASPVKWHLAHTTWFFETVVLQAHEPGWRAHNAAWAPLFNSYYHALGPQHPRPQRGLLTRPTLAEVLAWRHQIDERLQVLLQRPLPEAALALLELGLQHEQQHQELLLTDVKHLLAQNPLAPVYRPGWPLAPVAAAPLAWVGFDGGAVDIGHSGPGFAFDNEQPRHRQWLAPYALASRPVTHGEWADFIAAGGYTEPRWWLAAGWDWVRANAVQAPLYWRADGSRWQVYTLHGLAPLDPATPVVHVSLYEADAYARWAGAQGLHGGGALRLPTEAESEHACPADAAAQGNFLDSGALHPMPARQARGGLLQMLGDVWEWTSSAYQPYPGYRPWSGAVGEYNGKFMVDQLVLRGGSCATPRAHARASYRNFFPSPTRWQFCGLRLARDAL